MLLLSIVVEVELEETANRLIYQQAVCIEGEGGLECWY